MRRSLAFPSFTSEKRGVHERKSPKIGVVQGLQMIEGKVMAHV